MPTPAKLIGEAPGATVSNTIEASRPCAPDGTDTPIGSPLREITRSIRPVASSIFGENAGVTPPCCITWPSVAVCALRTAGLYVTVSVKLPNCETFVIRIGTVYGPAPMPHSGPDATIVTCPGVAGGGVAAAGAPTGLTGTTPGMRDVGPVVGCEFGGAG